MDSGRYCPTDIYNALRRNLEESSRSYSNPGLDQPHARNPKPTASAIVPQEGAEVARNLGLWGMPSAFHQGFEGHVSLGALPRPACNQKRGDKSITPIRQT